MNTYKYILEIIPTTLWEEISASHLRIRLKFKIKNKSETRAQQITLNLKRKAIIAFSTSWRVERILEDAETPAAEIFSPEYALTSWRDREAQRRG